MHSSTSAVRQTRDVRRDAKQDRKAVITDVVKLWEELRRHDTKASRRHELVAAILAQIKGRVAALAASHASSRVVQACVKHGSDKDRKAIVAEVKPAFCELAKNAYARFAVQKLVAVADRKGVQEYLRAVKGRVPELTRHPAAAHVIDELYERAKPSERSAMAAEFYGRGFRVLDGGSLASGEAAPGSLRELVAATPPLRRPSLFAQATAAVMPLLDKGLVDCALAHRVAADFVLAAPASLAAEASEAICGEPMLHMLHTRDGAAACCAAAAYATAKGRRKALNALKSHVPAAARDEWGSLVLVALLACVNDTAKAKKAIVQEYQKHLDEFETDRHASRVALSLLAPSSRRHLAPALREICEPPRKLLVAAEAGDRPDASQVDPSALATPEMMGDDAKGDEEEEEEEEEEEATEGAGGSAPSYLGESSKDPRKRRVELLSGSDGLAAALCASLATPAAASRLLRDAVGCDVAGEVLRGGQDAVLAEALGAEGEGIAQLQEAVPEAVEKAIRAVVEAAKMTHAEEEEEDEDEDEDEESSSDSDEEEENGGSSSSDSDEEEENGGSSSSDSDEEEEEKNGGSSSDSDEEEEEKNGGSSSDSDEEEEEKNGGSSSSDSDEEEENGNDSDADAGSGEPSASSSSPAKASFVPLLEDYYASRALRRALLAAEEERAASNAPGTGPAAALASALWAEVLSDPSALPARVSGAAAKVVAAVARAAPPAERPAIRKAVAEALERSGNAQSVDAWLETLSGGRGKKKDA